MLISLAHKPEPEAPGPGGGLPPDLVAAVASAPPHWADAKIACWDDDAFLAATPFVVEKRWSGVHSINVYEVVGTADPDYRGLSWREFLAVGKRMPLNLSLYGDNPGYYTGDIVKSPTMYYVALDDSGWFVNGDGNHRTCIARFAFHFAGRTMLHGITAERYRTDARAREVWMALREMVALRGLPLLIEPERETLFREDSAGWMRERYEVRIRIRDLRSGTDELLSAGEAEGRLDALRRGGRGLRGALRRLLG